MYPLNIVLSEGYTLKMALFGGVGNFTLLSEIGFVIGIILIIKSFFKKKIKKTKLKKFFLTIVFIFFSYNFSYASLFSLKNYYTCKGGTISLNPNGIKVIAVDGKSIEFWYSVTGRKFLAEEKLIKSKKNVLKDRIEKGDLFTDYFSYGSEQVIVRFVIKRKDAQNVKINLTPKEIGTGSGWGTCKKISKNQLSKLRF